MNYEKLQRRKRKAKLDGNKTLLSSVCVDLAEEYFRNDDFKLATKEYIEAANIFKQQGKVLDYAKANRMIGEAYANLRKYDKAIEYQTIYLNVAKEQKDKLEEQRALATIGHTYLTRFLDNIDEKDKATLQLAHKSFMKSMAVCDGLTDISKIEHMDMKARLLSNLGVVYEHLDKFQNAVELFEKSINICKQFDLYEQLERVYTATASLYTNKGEYNKAIHNLNLAIETAEKLDKRKSLMSASLLTKANILIKMSDFQAAKVVLFKAYKLKNPNEIETIERILKIVAAMCYTSDSLISACLNDYKTRKCLYEKLGDGASALELYTEAIEYYKKMLDCAIANNESGVELSPCYISLAETYRDNKQFDLSINYLEKELNVWNDNNKEKVKTLLNIADTMEVAGKEYSAICDIYRQAKTIVGNSNETELEKRVLFRFKEMLIRYGKTNEIANEIGANFKLNESDLESDVEESCTPNIGDDIRLDDLTGTQFCGTSHSNRRLEYVSEQSDAEVDQPRAPRKRTKGLTFKKNQKGETPLHVACIKGNMQLVTRLLDQGHPINPRDYCGWLPIHEACISGHKGIVQLLLDKGAFINDRGGVHCGGVTPLHDACVNGHLEIVELLLDRGATCLVKNDVGETPYHTLTNWYKDAHALNNTEEELYVILMERMKSALLKVGQSINVVSNENTAFVSVDDDEEEMDQSTPTIGQLRRACSFEADKPHEATEYKKVMENIRHRQPEEDKKRKSQEIEKPPWNDDQDWLINDVLTSNKKRRTSASPKLLNRPSSSSSLSSNCSDLTTRTKRYRQTALPEVGVSPRPLSPTLTSSRITDELNSSIPVVVNEPIVAVDVRIEEKFYRVPIPLSETHSRTIKWLGEEASKRYSRKECMKPELELETSNGAILADDDFVSILFPAGAIQSEKVYAKIIKWNLPPLHERYKEACSLLKIDVVDELVNLLQESTLFLDLNNRHLRSKMLPICKALTRQTNLTHLNLSGNLMENESLHTLASNLITLKNLTEINLSLNHINVEGLTSFSDIFTNSPQKVICENLSKLILSHNPLGNELLRPLAAITSRLRLKSLHLSDVDLTSTVFQDTDITLSLNYLQELDLSDNQLNAHAFGKILSWTNREILESLDTSGNCCTEIVPTIANHFLGTSLCRLKLKHLNVSHNVVMDNEVFALLRVLDSCNLQTLNLSGHSNLTFLSVRRLLQHQSFVELNLYDCENIFKYFESIPHDLKPVKLFRVTVNTPNEKQLLLDTFKESFGQEFTCKDYGSLLELNCK